MAPDDTEISVKIPVRLLEKLDDIARQRYVNRSDIIIDACAYYCQYHETRGEQLPMTMRSVFFNLARHDAEFRTLLRQILNNDLAPDAK